MNTLRIILFTLFALLGLSAYAKQPNLIFLMTDDQRWDNFGCYGRPEFRTHNIDRLAEEGVIFDRAYYAVAICMPSRATVMSGRYFSNHKVGFTYPYNLSFSKADYEDTYPARLKKAGYRTGFVGKFGFPVTDKGERLVDQETGDDLHEHLNKYFDFFAGGEAYNNDTFTMWPEDEALKQIYDSKRPREERTLKTGDAMLHFLDTQPKDQPFCLSVSFFAVKNDSDRDMYPPHVKEFNTYDFSVPQNWVEGSNPKLPKVVVDNWRGVPLHKSRTSTPELYQKLVRRFATQGFSVDQQVGRLVKKLEEMGVLDNTVIIYTSDNGRFHGSHGLYDKAILYEEAIKAPLIVFDGRVAKEKRGRRESAFISFVDIAPTILSLAGLEVPESMQGHDITGILQQTQNMEQWRDTVYMESLFLNALHGQRGKPNIDEINNELIAENKSYRCRGVRNEHWKYFIYYEHTPVIEELYDLANDPHEMNNLANDPGHAVVLAKLRKQTEEFYKNLIK